MRYRRKTINKQVNKKQTTQVTAWWLLQGKGDEERTKKVKCMVIKSLDLR